MSRQGDKIMKPQTILKHGRLPAVLVVVLIMSLGFTVVLASDPALTPSVLLFQSQPPVPPANDNFANAESITSLPFAQTVDAALATLEPGEPQYCYSSSQTVWYKLTLDHNAGVGVSHSSSASSTLTVYRANGPGFSDLSQVACAGYNSSVTFQAEAGATYYFQQGTINPDDATLSIDVQELPRPKNDDFADAIVIGEAPYTDSETITGATTQAGEQRPSCTESMYKTIWYAYKPTNSGSFMASTRDSYLDGFLAVWTGSQLGSLTEAGCRSFWGSGSLAFRAEPGTTYYIQVGSRWSGGDQVNFRFEVTPPPQAQFYYWPNDPSVFDTIQFQDNSWDPAGMGFQSQAWDFGDGTTAQGCCPTHRYSKDGDYTVNLTVTTPDGRTGSTAQTVHVATHDVAISKIDAPQAAKAGQTRQIGVNIKSTRYEETVRVELLKSVPGGYQSITSTEQNIPVRSGNRTTAVGLSYTFTDADAAVGKVTFKAVVSIVNARDALPADNEAIASPTKVSR
jgi:PKD repeat protein